MASIGRHEDTDDFSQGYDAAARDDAKEFARVDARVAKLEAALQLIAANKGKTIYSHDTEFRLGANAAFEQCAEIAEMALANLRSGSS